MSGKTKKKQIRYSASELRLKDLPMFAVILSAVIILMLLAGLRLRYDITAVSKSVAELSQGWYYFDGTERIDTELPARIPADGRSELVLYNDGLSEYASGSIISTGAGVYRPDIMRHGYLLYRYDDERFPKKKQTAARMYCTAAVNNDYGDAPLTIAYHLPYDADAGSAVFEILPVYVGSPKAVFVFDIGEHTVSIILTAAMLAAGCTAAVLGLYFRGLKESRRLNELAVFLFIFTVWCITDSGLLLHINDNGKMAAIGYLSFYTFMSFFIPVVMYAKHTEESRSRFYDCMIAVLAGNILVQTALNAAVGIPFAAMLPATHVILITEGLLIFIRMYRAGARVHNAEAVKFVLGEAFMILTGLISLEIYWVSGVYYPALFEAGVLLYAFYTIYDIYICVYNQETVRRKMMNDGLRHIEPVTGMPDDFIYMQDTEWLGDDHGCPDAEERRSGMTGLFGNDGCESEASSDEYLNADIRITGMQENDDNASRMRRLAAAAMLVRKAFDDSGACYCIGGDRLCVLMPANIVKAKQAAARLNEAAEQYNKDADSSDRIVLSCSIEEITGENKNI